MAEQEYYSGKILYPVTLALLVLSLLFGFAILPRLFSGPRNALVGKPAADFTLKLVANGAGDKTSLSLHDLQGSAVILDFWATWCGPCQREAPILNRVAQRLHDRGLVVVGVDTSEPDGRGGPWAVKQGLSYPIVYDEGFETAERYGVSNLPTLVVVSRTGEVTAVREGGADDEELESLVRPLL